MTAPSKPLRIRKQAHTEVFDDCQTINRVIKKVVTMEVYANQGELLLRQFLDSIASMSETCESYSER